ncbi:hypothetical protein TREMEDRAFT_60530 [Tremella mesenterica DSM 1558]|uniref:uncharacterized protein n=1 Tax=Tremella mesenterica (strain ATCC 24925 / CBS 8224 / DSM 1558 / NBRC 9311 / NRRL Y-6157 / RJB 2259-6 / UBC 559-6) TaxID=578456 RepID=UPI0003F4943E|nr:uncharacterized protein TREMEDRAFT_60530 [Tremella mesenterica DSM 1558]EIW71608.1 hypothetical protein TREMEDRAFT_60530 [Tremella mesenterica DSM 1558]
MPIESAEPIESEESIKEPIKPIEWEITEPMPIKSAEPIAIKSAPTESVKTCPQRKVVPDVETGSEPIAIKSAPTETKGCPDVETGWTAEVYSKLGLRLAGVDRSAGAKVDRRCIE